MIGLGRTETVGQRRLDRDDRLGTTSSRRQERDETYLFMYLFAPQLTLSTHIGLLQSHCHTHKYKMQQ